jgi:integrase
MAKINLTPSRINDLRCDPGQAQTFLWDSAVPGLAVRATPSGKKSFIVQGRLGAKTIRFSIGDAAATTLDKARDAAREALHQIERGTDPRVMKLQRIEEQAATLAAMKEEQARREVAAVMVREAWEDYLNDRAGRWSERHLRDHRILSQDGTRERRIGGGLCKPGPLAPLMMLHLADLTAERVEAWIKAEAADRPTSSRLALRLLRAFLGWCGEHPRYGQIAVTGAITTRAKQVLPKQQARRDCLQREQLAGWFKAVREIGNPVIAAYLQGLLLTGARREELAGLRWQDVDFKWGKIVIHDKVEGERTIPLTPYVAALLQRLPRRNGWVFSSPTAASGRIQSVTKRHNQALAEAGLDDHVSLHGLRRSFGSLAEWVEMPTGVVAQIMGHKPSATAERHYRVRPLDLLRQWADQYERWILEQAGIEQPKRQEPGEVLRLVAQ